MAQKKIRAKRSSNGNDSNRLKGSWVNDPVFSLLKGYSEADELVRDASHLYLEVRDLTNSLFPYTATGGSYKPKFSLESTSKTLIVDALHQHLIEESLVTKQGSRDRLYPNVGLKSFLDGIANALLTNGEIYYLIDWDTVSGDFGSLVLPVNFRYLSTATMTRHVDAMGSQMFVQHYNPLLPPREFPQLKGETYNFSPNDIVYLKYPYGTPPVNLAADLARYSWNVHQQLMHRAEAAAHPEDMRIELERARFASQKQLWRQYYLARTKIRRIFHLPFDNMYGSNSGIQVTDFYRAFFLVDHLRYITRFREFLLDEFNRQIVQRVLSRNSLPITLSLQYEGDHASNAKIESVYKAFESGQLTYIQFSEAIKSR